MEPARGAIALTLLLAAASAARAAGPIDAEMLRDLDVLGSPTYTRDREQGKRLPLIERLRMLETLRQAEAEPPLVPAPVPASRPPSSPSIPSSNAKEMK